MDDRLFDLIKQGASIRQLQLVLETGVDVNTYNDRHETPLMWAMLNIHDVNTREQILRTLLLYNADANCRNSRGQTPLMYSSILNQMDTMNILLNEPNINANVQDFEGNTALMYACALGKTDAVQKLVSAHQQGVFCLDPCAANIEGTNAMEYAIDSRDEEMKSLITTLIQELSDSPMHETANVNRHNEEQQVDSGRSNTEQPSQRIQQLAGSIDVSEHVERSCSATDKLHMMLKETEEGDANVLCLDKTPTSSIDNAIRKKRSVLNIHLPRANEEYNEEDIFGEDQTSVLESCELTPKYQNTKTAHMKHDRPKKSRKSKRAKKQNRKTSEKNTCPDPVGTSDNAFIVTEQPLKREFGEEVLFCNKIYGADLYPCTDEGEKESDEAQATDIIRKITAKTMNNFTKATELRMKHELTNDADITRKFDYMQLTPQDRGKLLGRTIWSAYGEPLPPIPISSRTLEKVVNGISRLRRYLARAKYQPGRLLSMDPEMWCIIESIRSG